MLRGNLGHLYLPVGVWSLFPNKVLVSKKNHEIQPAAKQKTAEEDLFFEGAGEIKRGVSATRLGCSGCLGSERP